MADASFLARIKAALEGKEKVVAGLKDIQTQAQKLSKTKVTTMFDPQGTATGKQIEETFTNVKAQAPAAKKGMDDFMKAINRAAIVAPVWLALRSAMMGTLRIISEQVQFLKDLEDAMARIKIVGKGTEEQYDNLKISLIGLSVTYGVVASAALKAAVIFSQQGKTVDEVIALTRTAMIASQVLGTDIVTTVDDMTAAIEGFNVPIDDSINIINKWINVEKQFAVTSKDLADATKVAGATANQMGVSISAFLGQVTAVIEVTRKSGSEAGRALSFIYARLLTTGKDAIQTIAKVPIYLDKQGQATNSLTNQYRTTTAVLDDVAAKWGTLTNAERLSIAQSVASKRQLTVFLALMQNYDAALKARVAALSAAGAAEKAFAIVQDTLSFKLNQLSSSWNNLTTSIGDTGTFKDAVDVMGELLNRWAAIINIINAYKNESKKVSDENQRGIQNEISTYQGLIELLQIRDDYLKRSPTEAGDKMLKDIDAAIAGLAGEPMAIDIDTDATIDSFNATIDMLRKQASDNKIDMEFQTNKDVLIAERDALKQTFKITSQDFIKPRFREGAKEGKEYFQALDRILKVQEEIKTLNDAIEAKKVKGRVDIDVAAQKEAAKIAAQRAQEEYNNNSELLPIEQEKLDATTKLNIAKASGVLTNKQLLQIEIDILDKYDEAETIHEHALNMAKLKAKYAEAELNDISKQKSILNSVLGILQEEESTIIRQEMAFKAMQDGEAYIKNSMQDRLRLAQALTKEAEEQNKKSAHAVELSKILRKYGAQTAQEVADYQGGQKSFNELSGQAKSALKKFVPSSFEQESASQALENAGIITPEAIQKEVNKQRNAQILNQVMIEPIELNINLATDEIVSSAVDAITKALTDKRSAIYQSVEKQIENY